MKTIFQEEERVSALLPSLCFGVVQIDAQMVITALNTTAERLLQINKQESISRMLGECLPWLAIQLKQSSHLPQKVISPTGQLLLAEVIAMTGRDAIQDDQYLIIQDLTMVSSEPRKEPVLPYPSQKPNCTQLKLAERNNTSSTSDNLSHNLSASLVYCSPEMSQVVSLAEKVAGYDTIILLRGESGVGKDVLAHYIHDKSRRKSGSFIKVNCGALPGNLLESELFGYEPGAFTGANKEGKKGLFELADKGTIFLDEIGELPQPLQVKLLSVIQDHSFYRVGGERPVSVDCRIIAATNANLEHQMMEGHFRRDLFYRLNVFPIIIPPLRDRPVDIPRLLLHFLQMENMRYDTVKHFSVQTFEMLLSYHWPGNVRELRNIVERLFVGSSEDCLDMALLPESLQASQAVSPLVETNTKLAQQPTLLPLKFLMAEYEREVLKNCIAKHRTLKECAEVLAIDLATLVRKRKKYKL